MDYLILRSKITCFQIIHIVKLKEIIFQTEILLEKNDTTQHNDFK
jgi:hypothetical protein